MDKYGSGVLLQNIKKEQKNIQFEKGQKQQNKLSRLHYLHIRSFPNWTIIIYKNSRFKE